VCKQIHRTQNSNEDEEEEDYGKTIEIKIFIKSQNVPMYILLDTDRNCAPLLLTGETPHDKQEAIVLTTTKISSCV
jgi:hypothetical protein